MVNTESQQGIVLGLGKVKGWLGTWVAPELFPDSVSYNSLASDKEFTEFCKSLSLNLSQHLTHSRWIPFLMRRQFINYCLSCSTCSFATNSSQFFNFLAIFRLAFLEESVLQFQFCTQAYFYLFWAWSAHQFPCCSWNRWDSNSWLTSLRAISDCSLSNVWPPRLLQPRILFAEPFSLLGRPSLLGTWDAAELSWNSHVSDKEFSFVL